MDMQKLTIEATQFTKELCDMFGMDIEDAKKISKFTILSREVVNDCKNRNIILNEEKYKLIFNECRKLVNKYE